MLKTVTHFVANPKILLIETTLGVTLLHYIEDVFGIACIYIIPTLCVILADLIWGIQAAKHRKERITFSSAFRRTTNKIIGYSCWVLFASSLGITYNYKMLPAIMMGLIFIIEGSSCLNNILEKRGLQISIKGILALIGRKTNHEGLEDVVEHKNTNQNN